MKKRSRIGRTLAVVLVLSLVFGVIGTGAWAELSSESTGTIQVSGIPEPDNGNVTVSAYRLMEVTVDDEVNQPQEPVYIWVDAVADWVAENYADYIDTENENAVTEAFSTDEMLAADMEAFYDALSAAIGNGEVTISVADTVEGNGNITGLPLGNYLLLTTGGVRVYKPSAVNLVPEFDEDEEAWSWSESVTAEVAIKSSEPTITKEIVDEDGSNGRAADEYQIGDMVYFKITVDIPKFPEEAISRNFIISDTLSDGLTFDKETLVVTADGNELEEGEDYSYGTSRPVQDDEDNNENVTFALDFSEKEKYDNIKEYDTIEVLYGAELNEDAVIGSEGNPNDAYLSYSNDPYDEGSWKWEGTIVKAYTYGIKVTKVDAKTEEVLPGAEFTVKLDGTELTFTLNEEDGYYYVDDEDGETTVVTDDNGLIELRGLKTGEYTLTETKAPNGYNLPKNTEFVIEIADEVIEGEFEEDGTTPKGGRDGLVEVANEAEAEADGGFVATTITNSKVFTLPTTGGAGTMLFSVIGILLMAGGAALIVLAIRRKQSRA